MPSDKKTRNCAAGQQVQPLKEPESGEGLEFGNVSWQKVGTTAKLQSARRETAHKVVCLGPFTITKGITEA